MESTLSTYSEFDDEELAIEAKRALAYLQKNRNYRYVEFLAQGGYGWVSLVYDDKEKQSLAIKCTNETSEMEISWWPRLHHPNILPLLEYLTLDTCTVFIMPAMRKDIWTVVQEPRFYEEELSFGLCRIWLRDVASALAYLHRQFLCHLDLKLDNVFLKEDGYACLGDFSLLSDIRKVPEGFHFLEMYEPPEYTQWCHGTKPQAIDSATKFGGDKADMWQYGILAVDLLTNFKLTGSKSSTYTLWHHDVWPLLQKILLHGEYLSYLLEGTFVGVLFEEEDFEDCHDFLKSILCLEPDSRMSAEDVTNHAFATSEWPNLPMEFTLPTLIVEHPILKPLPAEEMKDPSLTVEEVLAAAEQKKKEDDTLPETPSIGALDVIQRKMHKMQKEKMYRRESIAEEAGKKLLEIKPIPSLKKLPRKPTPFPTEKVQVEDDSSTLEHPTIRKTTVRTVKGPIKVTSIKQTRTGDVNKRTKKEGRKEGKEEDDLETEKAKKSSASKSKKKKSSSKDKK